MSRDDSRKTVTLIAIGAIAITISQVLNIALLATSLPLSDLVRTEFVRAQILRAVVSACLALSALSERGWAWISALGLMLLASGGVLTHGASRLEHALPLATVTVMHQLAASAWIGGLIHLRSQWHAPHWPQMVERFSRLAICALTMLLCGGAYLFWRYIHNLSGLIGTAYGAMLLTKVALFGGALLIGAANFFAVQRWKSGVDHESLVRKTPLFIELELGIGAIIIMASAALTDQSPAVDIAKDRASPREVAQVFAPKWPTLAPVSIPKMNSEKPNTAIELYSEPTVLEKQQSDFNHNVSGLFVIAIGLLVLLRFRHWPVLLIPFSIFLVIFAQPSGWPLGPKSFSESMLSVEAIQHRMATLLAGGIGYFEWRVQTKDFVNASLRFVFPILCAAGGALLLTHTHSIFALKPAFLIEVSHNAIGVLAVFTGAGRWMELKSHNRDGRIAGIIWPICFILIGVILLFYRE